MPLLRLGAVALSIGLAGFVIVNAQFGCDAASSEPPAERPPKQEPVAPEHAADAKAPAPEAKAPEQPAANAEPTPAANAAPAPNGAPPEITGNTDEDAPSKALLMPASKSGGDFGSVKFPGQGVGVGVGVLAPDAANEAQQAHDNEQQQAPQP